MKLRYDKPLAPKALAAIPGEESDFSDRSERESFRQNARWSSATRRNVTLRIQRSALDACKVQGRHDRTRMNAVLESCARAKLKRRS